MEDIHNQEVRQSVRYPDFVAILASWTLGSCTLKFPEMEEHPWSLRECLK